MHEDLKARRDLAPCAECPAVDTQPHGEARLSHHYRIDWPRFAPLGLCKGDYRAQINSNRGANAVPFGDPAQDSHR
jgi:hypothetical protein